jgi:hypothetical protein
MEAEQPLEDLIIIHPHLLQKFMRQGKYFANLLALYTFYSYQAKLQKTNQPLATDEFTRKGMNWAIDRVKKTKKLLKAMKLISVVQKGYYSYIKLPFIYTKKKIGEILGNGKESLKPKETEDLSPKKKTKTIKSEVAKLKPSVPSVSPVLTSWVEYCDKFGIRYGKSHLSYWGKKLDKRLTMEQREAVFLAINRKWKNFYLTPIKESKYHKLLGKSLMIDKDCDTLLDIDKKEGRYIYQFKNIRISSTVEPLRLFERYGYNRQEVKTAPIVEEVKERILGVIKRF